MAQLKDQLPHAHGAGDHLEVRLLLDGVPDIKWCQLYNEEAEREGVPAQAGGHGTRRGDETGYDYHAVLVVELPLDVAYDAAHERLNSAELLIRKVDDRYRQLPNHDTRAAGLAENWWDRRAKGSFHAVGIRPSGV
jgi:hypothetical protein